MTERISVPQQTAAERIIIGIDPGTHIMGYGVLRVRSGTPSLVAMGVIELNRFDSHYLRLRRIYERVSGLIAQYLPDEMAIEAPFSGRTCSRCSSWVEPRVWQWRQLYRGIFLSANMLR